MSKRTRREFLEQSMFATAAALAATSGTSVFARQANGRVSPNDTINVAVIGAGSRGGSHIGAFAGSQAMNTRITYLVDPDETNGRRSAQNVAKRQGGTEPKVVRDMRQVFDDQSVHVVSIATPNHWHSLAAIWAMQAGKDVYVEKPISHNVSEGRRVVEAARKLNRICQVGTQCRSNPGTADGISYIHGGGIGKVVVSRGLCYKTRNSIGPRGTYEVPATVDYDLWCGPAPKDPLTRRNLHYDWHWVWPTGNGDLGNQGIHQMDIARWALKVDGISDAVISYGGRLGYEDAGDTANTQVVILPYGDRSVVFEVRGLKTGMYRGVGIPQGNVVEGEHGYVVFPDYTSSTAFDTTGRVIRSFKGGGDHYANFIAAVRSRRRQELRADCSEGHPSSALCHLGNISYLLGEKVTVEAATKRLGGLKVSDNVLETFERTRKHLVDNNVDLAATKLTMGAWLTIDQKTERFTNDDKANTMLTRAYRAPYVVPANAAAI
jgi:predicted dehydrogenase